MNPIIIILSLIVILVLPDVYILLGFMRGSGMVLKLLQLLPTILLFITLLLLSRYRSTTLFGLATFLILCIVLPKFLFMIISLVGQGLGLLWDRLFYALNFTALCVAIVVSLSMFYGMVIGWRQLSVKEVELAFDDLPEAFDGYTVVHLSDLHVGTYGRKTAFLQKVVDKVNSLQPDLIVFTGDLVNLRSSEMDPFYNVLSQLQATDGIASVLGNHDYGFYGDNYSGNPYDEGRKVAEAERSMGWQALSNQHVFINRGTDSIAIVGVENTGKPPFPHLGDLGKAMDGVDSGTFKILLSHDPSHWHMEVLPKTDIPLTLSGHTHAAQFKLGAWSPSRWLYDEWSGLYEDGNQKLIVSEGVGGTIPFRLGTKPQIVKITLRKS